MLHRTSTLGAVIDTTIALMVGSTVLTPPGDMLCTVLAAVGAGATMLLVALRLEPRRS